MTFGNLGQHFELTALKGAGISLIRVLVPIFIFTLFLTGAAYYSNNYIVPKANLKAFSLLYDVKQMKPSMELKEGAFYNGIDGYSIKVGKKLSGWENFEDIIIYDHTDRKGNKNVTMADSGQMYNIYNDQYLVLEMFNGKNI
jgi:lipopolysaccharide export system permease protein